MLREQKSDSLSISITTRYEYQIDITDLDNMISRIGGLPFIFGIYFWSTAHEIWYHSNMQHEYR